MLLANIAASAFLCFFQGGVGDGGIQFWLRAKKPWQQYVNRLGEAMAGMDRKRGQGREEVDFAPRSSGLTESQLRMPQPGNSDTQPSLAALLKNSLQSCLSIDSTLWFYSFLG